MRLTVDREDAAYDPNADTINVEILLDGVRKMNVITADTDKGLIVQYIRRPNGTFAENAAGGLMTQTIYGKVEIVKL